MAARRLHLHNRWSQWTVAFVSVALLFIPLLQAFGVRTSGYTDPQLNVIQIMLAVTVFGLSLLLGFEEFGVKSERMHACATEVNRLAQEMLVHLPGSQQKYLEYLDRYQNVVQRYENHQQVDYLMQKLQNPADYFQGWWPKWCAAAYIVPRFYFAFLGYILILLAVAYVFYRIF